MKFVSIIALLWSVLSPSQSDSALEGVVVNAITGLPVVGAEVRLVVGGATAFPSYGFRLRTGLPVPSPTYTIATDASGRFGFRDVDDGTYWLGASAEGYAQGDFGQWTRGGVAGTRPETGLTEPVVLRLVPMASIGGTVADTASLPVADLAVYLLRATFDAEGLRYFDVEQETATDDDGRYRISAVLPGRYFLAVGPSPWTTPAESSSTVYGWLYYPGVSEASLAGAIELLAGTRMETVDLIVSPQESRRLSGRILDYRTGRPPDNASLSLVYSSGFIQQGQGLGWRMDVPYDPASGRFEVVGLSDGTYRIGASLRLSNLRAVSSPQDAFAIFEIVGSDVEDLALEVPSRGSLRGRISLANTDSFAPSPHVHLVPTHELQPNASAVADSASGSFAISTAISGKYRLALGLLPDRAYVSDVILNGRRIRGHLLDIPTSTQNELEIILRPDGAEIQGVAVDERQQPVPGASGLLLPDPLPQEIGFYRHIPATGADGRFVISGVAPGRYRIYIWNNVDQSQHFDPVLLRRSTFQARPILVNEGSRVFESVNVIRLN